MNNSFRIPSRRPRAKRPKAPMPAWFKPLTWLTALLAAGCLVLLAGILQGQAREQRFQSYQAVLAGIDTQVRRNSDLQSQIDELSQNIDLLQEFGDLANGYVALSTTFLMLEVGFQQGYYEDCAVLLYDFQNLYPDLVDRGGVVGSEQITYCYADRYRELVDFLTEGGYLVESPNGSLSLPERSGEESLDLDTASIHD